MNIEKNNGTISLRNKKAECKIALYGGNLISYRPKNAKQDVFWLGELNKFDNIQAIRGGIPVCWPRFAEETLNNHLPRHGFARLSVWNVCHIAVDDDKMEAELNLVPDSKFNVQADVKLLIKITDKLEYSLETINQSNEIFEFSEALHAYFNISSLDNIVIKGLDNHEYKNSLDGQHYKQEGDLKINGEFDSVFMNQTLPLQIVDSGYNRIIEIEKEESKTTVVWNPNKDLAEMSSGQYKQFVCVEPSNVGAYSVKLQPRAKHKISAKITVRQDIDFE